MGVMGGGHGAADTFSRLVGLRFFRAKKHATLWKMFEFTQTSLMYELLFFIGSWYFLGRYFYQKHSNKSHFDKD